VTDRSALPPPPLAPPVYPPYAPAPLAVAPALPRKWLGPKGGWLIFLVLTAFWGANLIFNAVVLHTSGVSPNTMVLGGLGMTTGLLVTLDVTWLRYARRLRREDDAAYASASPVGSTAVGSSSDSPPTGSPFH
jgi:hypothetical protein